MTSNPLIPPSPTEEEERATAREPTQDLESADADPIALFESWLADAVAKKLSLANAMSLATVDADGHPDCRMVLLKGVDVRGFTFYSNSESAKGLQLAANPYAALCFHWQPLGRQVRVRGPIETVTDDEADVYFATRARSAQVGAWASEQSRPMPDRYALERRVVEFGVKFGVGSVSRPPHWRGYRVAPHGIEFWRERPFRLHERRRFTFASGRWRAERLYP